MIVKLEIDSKEGMLEAGLISNKTGKIQDTYKISSSRYEDNINANSVHLGNSILPPAVRYLDMTAGVVLFERPPSYVPFHFTGTSQNHLAADGASKIRLNLPIPWQRYVMHLAQNGMPAKLYVFFANQQIESLDEALCVAPLPNLYEDCSVCLPVYDHIEVEYFDLMSAISNAYNTVWKSGFNLDILKAFQNWAANTSVQDNPLVKHAHGFGANIDRFYKTWSNYSLQEVVNFSWRTIVYSNFDSLLSSIGGTAADSHERVVDILLAARS